MIIHTLHFTDSFILWIQCLQEAYNKECRQKKPKLIRICNFKSGEGAVKPPWLNMGNIIQYKDEENI